MPDYGHTFYAALDENATKSARAAVPTIVELLRPARIVDLGCGDGTWLRVFQEHGVSEILGIDQHAHFDLLKIPTEQYRQYDLCKPLPTLGRFDLALSLEVAEHLPERSADEYVASLVALAPMVLFSAAIPLQGGTGHINEQWPTYWSAAFAKHGYVAVDCIRPRIWNNAAIAPYYRQNCLLFCDDSDLATRPDIAALATRNAPLSIVHPDVYLHMASRAKVLARIGRVVPESARAWFRRHVIER